ncbi:Ig-specific serine endopeptidase MIP [Mycoplasmopsis alligatoris]|uniref:Lipofamily protein n=1 Tax=Mycoplasmopsis alligatoris A21JP2 TaxID=747682 RepID=D4XWT4_9BACT|nr:DUF31 family protein [Mycoplasmopsis alligatoris]EFF41252.1 lipofamily protein [Mycoplasmopsis alligatoris A21JP2]
MKKKIKILTMATASVLLPVLAITACTTPANEKNKTETQPATTNKEPKVPEIPLEEMAANQNDEIKNLYISYLDGNFPRNQKDNEILINFLKTLNKDVQKKALKKAESKLNSVDVGYSDNELDFSKRPPYEKTPISISDKAFAPDDITKWSEANEVERWKIDFSKYKTALLGHIKNERPPVLLPGMEAPKFAKPPKDKPKEIPNVENEINYPSYEDAQTLGFASPVVEDEKIKVLDWQENERGKSIHWTTYPYTAGLARTLPNAMYKKIAKQTYAFDVIDTALLGGTAWILDFKLEEDGSYPKTWYFGANVHQLKRFSTAADTEGNYRDQWNSRTTELRLTKVKDSVLEKEKLYSTNEESQFEKFSLKPFKARTVFLGIDFLNKDPKDFVSKNSKSNILKEYIDFGVIEITFDTSELAKKVTSNYALNKDEHISFLKNSFLKDYPTVEKGKSTIDDLYILGYPNTNSDASWDLETDEKEKAKKPESQRGVPRSLYTNKNKLLFNNFDKNWTEFKNGGGFSRGLGHRSFIDKPGVFDSLLSQSKFGSYYFPYELPDNKTKFKFEAGNDQEINNLFVSMGLGYLVKNYSPASGSSGSSVRNGKNELVGIFSAGNNFSNEGIVQAFRSEGYDYKGYFGDYNLPQYDLIYGGGKDQRISYREMLKKLYKDKKIKTNLFKDGLDTIPDEYKFK